MKKLLALLIAGAMCLSLVACGNNSEPDPQPAANEATQDAGDNDDNNDDDDSDTEIGIVNGDVDDSEEYAKAMGDFAEAFEGLIEELGNLIALADEFEDEEDIEVWANTFVLIKDSIGYCVEMLAEAMEEVPEEYVESHLNITLAVSAVYDAMTSFQDAVDAAIEGDEDAFLEGMTTFVELFEAADELWNEAVI